MTPTVVASKFSVLAGLEFENGMMKISFPFEIKPVVTSSVVAITQSEQRVLHGMQQGLSHKEIGVRYHISERTSKFHASSLFKKFGVSDKTELLRIVGFKAKD